MLAQSCKKTTRKRGKKGWMVKSNGLYLVITFYLEFKSRCWPISLNSKQPICLLWYQIKQKFLKSVLRHDRTVGTEKQRGSSPYSLGLPSSHHAIITPSLCLHKEKAHWNKNSPFLPSRAMSASSAGFLPVEWRVDIWREEPAPAESHRPWTRGGREWLRAGRMSQASCVELATQRSQCPEWFLLALLWSKWATFC